MTYRPTMAELQAIGVCWLARAKGLPDVYSIRVSVVQMHPEPCGWCDYSLPDLMAMLKSGPATLHESEFAAWWQMPGRARRAAIELAQGMSQ